MIGGGAAGHVIDNGRVDPSHNLPGGEKPHRPKPSLKASLFLQPESVKDDAGCDEEGDGADNRSKSREE